MKRLLLLLTMIVAFSTTNASASLELPPITSPSGFIYNFYNIQVKLMRKAGDYEREYWKRARIGWTDNELIDKLNVVMDELCRNERIQEYARYKKRLRTFKSDITKDYYRVMLLNLDFWKRRVGVNSTRHHLWRLYVERKRIYSKYAR